MASTVSGKGIDHYKWHRLLSEKASTVKNGVACLRKGKLRRRYEGTQYRSQPSSDLPSERVSEDPPFTHVDLDSARALCIGDRNSIERANESSKAGICVPVHLCVGPSSSLRNDPRSQRSNIPISLQTICESTRATSNADLRPVSNAAPFMRRT